MKNINKTIYTNKYGKAYIIGQGEKNNYLKVKFENTGTVDEFRKDAVLRGEIRDKYAVTLYNIGIVGNIKTRGKYKRYYTVWRNMISRCYAEGQPAYYNIVTVSDKWKTFENFFKDTPNIDGWNSELFNNGMLVLDKDLKQRYSKNKMYSLETCTWVSKEINNSVQDKQQTQFIAISPCGIEHKDYNIARFAREHNLERKQISAVLHNRYKSTNGWTFKYINKEIV